MERERVHCSSTLNRTLVLQADAMSEAAMEEAGIHTRTAYIALTGDDENNIMNCLMAQKMGAAYTITQIARTDFVPVVEQLYLVNRVVSPYISTTHAILHWLRSKRVRAASLLHNLPGELLTWWLLQGMPLMVCALRIFHSTRSVIATVLRGQAVHTATGDLQLLNGDRVLVFTHADEISEIRTIFQ